MKTTLPPPVSFWNRSLLENTQIYKRNCTITKLYNDIFRGLMEAQSRDCKKVTRIFKQSGREEGY